MEAEGVKDAHAALSERPVAEGDGTRVEGPIPSACTCTSRSAGSAATSVTSGSTPTRTRARSSSISICWRASGSCTPRQPAVAGRQFNFVYFGGGTPSFLSTKQLQGLVGRLNATGAWNGAEEITFECEPGTLTEAKLAAIRELGVTRLSLGVENFDDRILELNGRAHRSPEIGRAYEAARALGFPQINIDLIAGMLGETDANWRDCIERTLALEPDSVTIYQMELPYNTTISGDLLKRRRAVRRAGRRLGDQAALGAGGVRRARARRLSRRQRLYRGEESRRRRSSSIAIACGKAPTCSASAWRRSATSTACTCRTSTRGRSIRRRSSSGEIPLGRAYRPSDEERLIREFVLQLKRGSNRPSYFAQKYGVDVLEPLRRRARLAARRRLSRRAERRSHCADARRPDARRRAAAPLLPAGTRRHSLHLTP